MPPFLKVEGVPYTINNFRSSYLSFVHPAARNIVHGGEIDSAIHSLTREGIESVVAVELSPSAAAMGLWKKEAISQLKRIDYAALLCIVARVKPFLADVIDQPFEPVAKRCTQLKTDAPYLNSRIMENLPPWAVSHLQALFESGQPAKSDNGTIADLHYLEPSLYDRAKDRLDCLEICVGDVYNTASRFPEADMVCVNNNLDYIEWDLGERLKSLASGLKKGARLVLASTKAGEFVDERIRLREDVHGLMELFDWESETKGKALLLSDYLRTFGLQLTPEEIVFNSEVRVRAFELPVSPAVAAYRMVSTREMPESGLPQITTATNEAELKKVYMSLAAGAYKDLNLARYSWEDYWDAVEKDARSSGVSPFEKSDAVFLLATKLTPAQLIFSWFDDGRISVPRKATVEIYQKI